MSLLEDVSLALQAGRAPKVKELVQQAVDEGIPAKDVLEQGLLSGMSVVGEKFNNNEVFVPEVLIAARAMNAGVLTDGDAAMLQSAAFLRAQLVYISYYALEADLPDGSQSLADHLMDLGVFTRDEWRGSWKLVKSERL